MGRGSNEGLEAAPGLRSALIEPPWDGVEIKILIRATAEGLIEVETAAQAYDLDSTRMDQDLSVGKERPAGPLTKTKLGEQLHRALLAEIAERLGVPYGEA